MTHLFFALDPSSEIEQSASSKNSPSLQATLNPRALALNAKLTRHPQAGSKDAEGLTSKNQEVEPPRLTAGVECVERKTWHDY